MPKHCKDNGFGRLCAKILRVCMLLDGVSHPTGSKPGKYSYHRFSVLPVQKAGPYHVGSRGPATRIMFFLYVYTYIYIRIYIYTFTIYTYIHMHIHKYVYASSYMFISSLQIHRLHTSCASGIFLNPTSDPRVAMTAARKLQQSVLLSMTKRGGSELFADCHVDSSDDFQKPGKQVDW